MTGAGGLLQTRAPRRLLVVVTGFLASVAVGLAPVQTAAGAEGPPDVTAAGAALEAATAESAAARVEFTRAQSLLPPAQAQKVRAAAELQTARREADGAQRRLAASRQFLVLAQQRSAQAAAALQVQRDEAAALARALYQSGPPEGLRGLAAAQNLDGFVDQAVGVGVAGTTVQRKLVAINEAAFVATQAIAAARQRADRVASDEAAVFSRLDNARVASERADRAAADVAALLATRARAVAIATAAEAADRQRYEELQTQSARTAELLAQRQRVADAEAAQAERAAQEEAAAQAQAAAEAEAAAEAAQAERAAQAAAAAEPDTAVPPVPSRRVPPPAAAPAALPPAQDGGRLTRPTGGPVVSSYGSRSDPVTGRSSFHPGMDISGPTGQPIVAAAAGTVALVQSVGESGGYGNYTCLEHGGGLATCYAHQSSVNVRPGERVARGQLIGRVGSTGYSTGAHLHFEVRVGGQTRDPANYL